MPSVTLQTLRQFTGTDGPELADAIARLPIDDVDALAQQILEVAVSPPSIAPGPAQVWPLVTLRASTFASGGVYRDASSAAGVDLNSALNPRLSGTGHFSNGVLRALLYSHGLLIEDPLGAAAELISGTKREVREIARLALVAAASAAVEIGPLLDHDIVTTFFGTSAQQRPVSEVGRNIVALLSEGSGFTTADAWDSFEASYVDGLSPSLQILWRHVRPGNTSPSLDLLREGLAETEVEVVSTFVKVLSDLRPHAVIENAAEMVAASVVAVESLEGRFDLHCPSPLFAKMLFLGSPDPAHELRLSELGRIEVPGIANLDVTDAVRIREVSDQFARWRSDLTEALTHANQARAAGRSQSEIAKDVRELVAGSRRALQNEARRSRFLNARNTMTFVAGALGGALAGTPGGAMGSTYGAAGGSLALIVQAALAENRIPAYLDRHYLAFEKTKA